jgi:serine/threonine protein kinase
MPPDSAASLAEALRHSRLLEPAQLDELTQTLTAQSSEPRALARELVRRGWLTPYQVNQLFLGRGHELLLGSYVLLEKLGEGGMGAVFKARNWKLGRTVALKLIRKERLSNPDTVRRFQREVRAAAALDHPNVVRAHDADEVGGTHLLVMEYVEGTDLARLVKQRGALPVGQACDYVRQAALGLQHAHERGLVHRDIKPANLMLTPAGVVKLMDLGLARLDRADGAELSSTMTMEGCVVGTPDYVAPEQTLDSHAVDIRADLYTLGCTLYHLLTGRVPFPGGSLGEKIAKHQ